VILLDDVVQVFALTEANPTRQNPFVLQCFDGRGISPVLIHVYDTRRWFFCAANTLWKKRLAASVSRFAVSRKSMVWPVNRFADIGNGLCL
jgi:hypothetical protein